MKVDLTGVEFPDNQEQYRTAVYGIIKKAWGLTEVDLNIHFSPHRILKDQPIEPCITVARETDDTNNTAHPYLRCGLDLVNGLVDMFKDPPGLKVENKGAFLWIPSPSISLVLDSHNLWYDMINQMQDITSRHNNGRNGHPFIHDHPKYYIQRL